jgi:hypothetical protein
VTCRLCYAEVNQGSKLRADECELLSFPSALGIFCGNKIPVGKSVYEDGVCWGERDHYRAN